jgi:hypothetical protein
MPAKQPPWTNPNTNGVVIDPCTFVIATGYIEADADKAYWLANVSNVSNVSNVGSHFTADNNMCAFRPLASVKPDLNRTRL